MVFFGSRGKVVPGRQVDTIECPECGNRQFLTFGILRYFHIYWIPVIPIGRNVGAECGHCKKTLMDEEVPSLVAKNVQSSVFTAKRMLPMFTGAIIIVALGLFGAYALEQESKQETQFLQHPAVADYYVVDLTKIFEDVDPEFKFGVMKVVDVTENQIEVLVSTIAYNTPGGTRDDIDEGKAADSSYYSDGAFVFNRSNLAAMRDSGAIRSVKRL